MCGGRGGRGEGYESRCLPLRYRRCRGGWIAWLMWVSLLLASLPHHLLLHRGCDLPVDLPPCPPSPRSVDLPPLLHFSLPPSPSAAALRV